MKDIREVEIEGQKVYLKKSGKKFRTVYLWQKKYNNGKINWENLISGGNWLNLIFVIIFVAIILLAINEYVSNLKLASACLRALPDYIPLKPYLDNPTLVNNLTGLI